MPIHRSRTAADLLFKTLRRYALLCMSLVLLALPGCGGCSNTKTLTKSEAEEKLAEEQKKKKAEEKEPLEWGKVYSLPNDLERQDHGFKPGHWTEFITEAWANDADFSGDLVTDPFRLLAPFENNDKNPEVAPYRQGTSRPAILPKQQKKHLGMVLFVPPGSTGRNIHFRLTPRGSSRSLKEQIINAMRQKSWTFNMLVLAANPDDYRQLLGMSSSKQRGAPRVLDALRPSISDAAHPYYRVKIPTLERYVPVSENSLAWTSTAYLIWDGIDPALLTPEQQRAMLDWIHWGGQLIVSGPGSLDLLKESFLSPYLPATAEADMPLGKDDLVTFSGNWTNKFVDTNRRVNEFEPGEGPSVRRPDAAAKKPGAKETLRKPKPLVVVQPWSGSKLKVAEDANVEVLARSDRADRAPLVVDRRIGLGRICVTAFRLGQKELRPSAWPSFDAFFNGCLLRRPPREFVAADSVLAFHRQGDTPFSAPFHRGEGYSDEHFAGPVSQSLDPKLVSRVRFFSRDATLPDDAAKTFSEAESLDQDRKLDEANLFLIRDQPLRIDPGDEVDPDEFSPRGRMPDSIERYSSNDRYGSGVAGWNDFNHPSQLARIALTDAAGIVIPKTNKVIMLLAIYLIVLVPLNWLVFRIINRVEWAWIAAPIITLGFSVAIIRFAELDVGFARSRTEVAVVEIHGDYARAHVTRYAGVYTSLATAYDVQFDDPSSVVQPYATHSRKELEKGDIYMRQLGSPQFRRDDQQIRLSGFDVDSNSTGMLHAEHMLTLGGGFSARHVEGMSYEITNGTNRDANGAALDLKGAALLSRDGAVWIGDFAAGEKKTVTLSPRALARSPEAKTEQKTSPARGDGELEKLAENARALIQGADWFPERERDSISARAKSDDLLKARLLLRLAENAATFAPGELRLVAWTADELPGMRVAPGSTQGRFANVIVVHLRIDAKLKHLNWELGYRNLDHSSREERTFDLRSVDRMFGGGMYDGGVPYDLDNDGLPDIVVDRRVPLPRGSKAMTNVDPKVIAQRYLKKFDKNTDGVVDRTEWPPNDERSALPPFEMDADADGKITPEEIEAYCREQFSGPPEE